MTLSDHKGKQLISDTIQKCFLSDFLTIFINNTGKKARAVSLKTVFLTLQHPSSISPFLEMVITCNLCKQNIVMGIKTKNGRKPPQSPAWIQQLAVAH
jgi:hypothetical protein